MFDVKKEAAALSAELETIYKDLHRHPEIGYDEHRTSGIIADYLRACGMEVQTGIAITGVVGTLDSGRPGKTLLIRADMDCLQVEEMTACDYRSENPGKMHACGHDAHVTMLLGAAKLLSAHRDAFRGKIKFLFEPSEESIPASMKETVRAAGYDGEGGAGFMIQQGVLEGVDMALALHVQPAVPAGKIQIARHEATASSDVYDIMLTGKGGHGAMPENAVDPVPTMAELITAIHMLPTREVSSMENCVISIGQVELPGSVWNVVPERAHIVGGFRTFNNDVRALLRQRIPELAEGIAKANRCTAVCTQTLGYDATINDEAMALEVSRTLENIVGEGNVILTNKPFMGSEDFGCFTQHVPGVLFWLGIGTGEDDKPLHNPYFKMDLNALPVGTACHVQNALHFLK